MNFKKFSLERILVSIIVVTTTLTFFAPLVVARHSYYPFLFPKVSLMHVLIEISIATWILLALRYPKYRPNWRNPMVEAVLIFMLALLVVLPFSIDIDRSFFSTSSRMTGLFQWLNFAGLFLVISSTFKTWKDWKVLFFASNIATVLASLFGFIQMNGLVEQRISSTMGNPIFLGVYAMIGIFVALVLLIKEKDRRWQGFYLLSAVINLYALILSASRGPLLGLVVALFLGAILFASSSAKGKQRVAIITGLLILVILSILTFLILRINNVEQTVRPKMPYAVSRIIYANVGADRFEAWDLGISGFKDRPLFGWGQENLLIPANLYMDRPGRHSSLKDIWFDRSHNQFIDILATTGVIGFLGFIFMWGSALWLTIRLSLKAENAREKLVGISLFMMFVGYLTSLMFLFDIPTAILMTMLFFAFAANLHDRSIKYESTGRVLPVLKKKYAGVLSLLVILPMLFVIYRFTIVPYHQSIINTTGIARASSIGTLATLDLYKRSLSQNSYLNDELVFFVHDSISQRAGAGDRSEATMIYLEFLAEELEKEIEKNPHDFRFYIFAAETYRWRSANDPELLVRATQLAERAIELGPRRSEGYLELAEIALLEGNYDHAMLMLIEAAKRVGDMKLMSGELRTRAAAVFFKQGNSELAFRALDDARAQGYPIYGDARVAIDIDNNYNSQMDLVTAMGIVERIWTVYRTHSGVLHARATLFNAAGDMAAVETVIQIVAETDQIFADHMRKEFGLELEDEEVNDEAVQ